MAEPDLECALAPDGVLRVALGGDWKLGRLLPAPEGILGATGTGPLPRSVSFDTRALAAWDSGLLTFLVAVLSRCAQMGVAVDTRGLPHGVTRLLAIATAVPARTGPPHAGGPAPILARVGAATVARWRDAGEALAFLGDALLSLVRLLTGRGRFRHSDFLLVVQDCGARAVPIVSLVNVLVGLVLGFIGAVQLRRFGAQIYVADLVAIATVRDIGAIMTGIIVTGRTGASFAARLGTMEVNEELDALRTLGIPPMDFLVLPRLLALTLMMPLLCLYADLMGMLGGFVVAVTMLDINPTQYYLQTQSALRLKDVLLGLFMSGVFGVIVALSGCRHGIGAGRSAAAVGKATTSAVVSGIVTIVVATAIITGVSYVLGI